MANTGKTVAVLLIGAVVGAAVGYMVATDDKKRKEDLEGIKSKVTEWGDKLKNQAKKMKKKTADVENEIYNG